MARPGRSLTWACAVALLAVGLAPSATAAPAAQADGSSAPQLYAALAAALDPDTNRPAPRLARVSVDPTGDATVVFAIRNEQDDADATRARAVADTLTVLRTAYASEDASRISTMTVLGTFPYKGTKGKSVRESPVLRAVLSADRAAQLDWDALSPDDLDHAVDVWWMQGAFAGAISATPDDVAPDPLVAAGDTPAGTDELRPRLEVATAHLTEALDAAAAYDVRIARSQFKQFFDAWDEIDEPVAQRFPDQYAALDVELERAEVALLHTQPEDIDTARSAMQNIRTLLQGIDGELDSPAENDLP